MNFKQLILLMYFAIPFSLIAQETKFKKVSKEELLQTQSLIEPDASFEYFHRSCEVEYVYINSDRRYELAYTYFFRIKIYDDQKLDVGDRVINYFIGGDSNSAEKVDMIEAYTFNLVNNKVSKVKLKKDNIYDEKVNSKWASKKLAMPSVQVGSVLDIKFRIKSPYIAKVKKFYFQQNCPVVFAQYKIEIPEFYTYTTNVSGYHPIESRIDSREVAEKVKKYSRGRRTGMEPLTAKNSKYTSKKSQISIKIFSASTIPSLQKEPFVNNMKNYKLGVSLELYSTQYGQSRVNYYSNSWQGIVDKYLDKNDFGGELTKDYGFYNFIDSLSILNREDRVTEIFNKVRDSYQWNYISSELTGDGIENLIETKSGNVAEINLLLTNLLRKAGIDAIPVLMRNRYYGSLNVSYPTRSEINYVIVQVQLGGDLVYLDATDKHLSIGQLPRRAINRDGVLVNANGGTQIVVTNKNMDYSSRVIELSILDGKLRGEYLEKYKMYKAYQLHSIYSSNEDYLVSQKTNGRLTLVDSQVTGLENNVGDVSISAKVDCNKFIQNIEGKIFIDYALHILPKSSPFVSSVRQFALFFDCKKNNTSIVKYAIPDGYKIESLPESMTLTLPNKMMSCLVQFKASETELLVTIRSSRKVDLIAPEFYDSVLEFYDLMIAKGNEKVVLGKI